MPKLDRYTIPPMFTRLLLWLLAVLSGAVPAAAQYDLWRMPTATETAARAAPDARMEAIVRETHRSCVARTIAEGGDSKAFDCNGVLVFAFSEARRRGMAGLEQWAVRTIAASTFPETEAANPHALLGEIGNVIASSDYPRALPLYDAYVADALKAGRGNRAALDDLVERAETEDRWGRPATEAMFARAAATLAARIEGADAPLTRRMAAQGLRADVLLARPVSPQDCTDSRADEIALNRQVSCAIAIEHGGRWREAEERLRTLLPVAQAQKSPVAQADVLVALGRNLIRQERWGEAVEFLTTARDLLVGLSTAEDDRLIRMPAVRAARASAMLGIATANLSGGTVSVNERLLGRFHGAEVRVAAADAWARAAERLQRGIDNGSLKWEGGVWRQMSYAYEQAADELKRLYGAEAPIVGVLRVKHVDGQEKFLTDGFRRSLDSEYTEGDLRRDMDAALGLIAPIPLTDPYRIEGMQVAAGFLSRAARDVPRARSLCRAGMAGALDRMTAAREFDMAAQAQLRARNPLFTQCVRVAWLATQPAASR